MKALILAAAMSPKLSPFTETRPKSMILLSGERILETLLRQLKEAGIREITIVVGHQKEIIQEYFHFGKALDLKIDYLIQEEPTGIGGAALLAKGRFSTEEPFLLAYGDVLMESNCFKNLLSQYEQRRPAALATITHPLSEGNYGNVYLSQDVTITKFLEKPEGRHSNYIFGGSFILKGSHLSELERLQGDMVALYQSLIEKRELEAALWEDQWIDISRPWHILSANRMMMRNWKSSQIPASVKFGPNVTIEGPIKMGEGVTIESGATIIGPCYIGDGVYIGNNALIRDHSSIGPESVIGFGTEIKNAVLFGKTTVGRLSFIGDSVLGEGVYLGSGAMTVNITTDQKRIQIQDEGQTLETGLNKLGAFIGDNASIGAGHILKPASLIPSKAILEDRFTN